MHRMSSPAHIVVQIHQLHQRAREAAGLLVPRRPAARLVGCHHVLDDGRAGVRVGSSTTLTRNTSSVPDGIELLQRTIIVGARPS